MWPESLAQWAELGAAFQGFATGLAVLAGAGWAIVRFFSLREVEQAKLTLERGLLDLAERQPILDLALRAKQTGRADGQFFVSATVVAKNNGTKVARLAYDGTPPLAVFAVEFADGVPVFREERREHVRMAVDPNQFAKTTIVRPGQSDEIPFLVKVSSPGWYYLTFRAVQSAEDREHLRAAGVPDNRIVSWTAKQYVRVAEDAPDSRAGA
jgi:hypothetical protein